MDFASVADEKHTTYFESFFTPEGLEQIRPIIKRINPHPEDTVDHNTYYWRALAIFLYNKKTNRELSDRASQLSLSLD